MANFPAAQSWHAVVPTFGLPGANVPTAQVAQALAPVAAENVPGEQGRHDEPTPAYVPGGQLSQFVLYQSLVVPAAQAVQTEEPGFEKKPVLHVRHCSKLLDELLNVPA